MLQCRGRLSGRGLLWVDDGHCQTPARFFATAQPGDTYPLQAGWSKKVIWGNNLLTGGVLTPGANAFDLKTTWGVTETVGGANIVWGTVGAGNIVWGTSRNSANNIVWGTDCDGDDCDNTVWGSMGAGNIVWGTAQERDNILWSSAGLNVGNIVWGSNAGGEQGTWGSSGEDNLLWATPGSDNILTAVATPATDASATAASNNIVWSTVGSDNIVWGTTVGGNIVWQSNAEFAASLGVDFLDQLNDEQVFALLAATSAADHPDATAEDSASTGLLDAPMGDAPMMGDPLTTLDPAPAVEPTPEATPNGGV